MYLLQLESTVDNADVIRSLLEKVHNYNMDCYHFRSF